MKQWISRYAVLAVLGTVLCSMLVMGCGGNSDETADANAPAAPGNGAPPPAPPAPPAP